MPYKFVEGVAMADVTFEATGKTLEELFESSGKAVTNSMVENLDTVEQKVTKKFCLKANNIEKLLHDFMDELVFYKDAERLLFSGYKLKVKQGNECIVEAQLKGEELDMNKHELITDVKAVSWHMYKVEKKEEWKAFVILDV